jgi:DNA-binding CsgD family transcriptional regulator
MHEAPGGWPLIGRADALARVVSALTGRRGGGLVVAGRAGEGKTRLLAAARDRAERAGVTVYWAVATDAAAGVPLAPFAPLLPAAANGAGPTARLSLAAAALTGAPGPHAVAVDDAHLLDPASVTLVAHLMANTPVPVVLTARAIDPPWLRDLDRITVEPLSEPEIVEVLETALGAAVETALSARLATLSQGNPLLLRELVGAALAAGAVRRDGDLWRATGPLVVATDLPTAIRTRLERLPPAVRDAAELVALAEPVDAPTLEALLSAAALAGLEEERLLAEDTPGRLRLVHPLYAESLRATMPPMRGRQHRRRLAEAVEARSPLRAAIYRLDGGLPADPNLLLAAAREAADGLDHDLAGRLARAAVEAGGGFEARMVLLSELPYQGRGDAALALADELAAEAERADSGPDAWLRVASARSNLELVLGLVAPARATLAAAGSRARRPHARLRIAMQQAAQAFSTGRIGASIEHSDEVLARSPDDHAVLGRLALSRVRALACAGRTSDAIAFAERALDAVAGAVDGPGAVAGPGAGPPGDRAGDPEQARIATIRMTLLQALAFHGEVSRAEELGRTGLAAASRGPAAALRAFWAHELGQVAVLRGHAETSRRWLREALAVMPIAGLPASPQLWTLDALTEAEALLGDAAAAAAGAARLRAVLPAGFVPVRCSGSVWAVAAAGEVSNARRLALEFAASLDAEGATMMAAWVLHDAVRLGAASSEVADELAGHAARSQSPLVAAFAGHGAALAAADPLALDRASAALAGLGCDLWAAEAAGEASRFHRRAGNIGSALSSAAVAVRLFGRCGPVRAELARPDVSDPLTRREREVADLAARGLSDRDIAARLHLSERTVQSHLYRSYRKLGVRGRDDLG